MSTPGEPLGFGAGIPDDRLPDDGIGDRGEERGQSPVARIPEDPLTLAALAAVEGRSLLRPGDPVDDALVDELEYASGALYAALTLARDASGFPHLSTPLYQPSPEAMARLEHALLTRVSAGPRRTDGAVEAGGSNGAATLATRPASEGRGPRLLADPDRGAEGASSGIGASAHPNPTPRQETQAHRGPHAGWAMVAGWVAAAALFTGLVVLQKRNAELATLAGLGDPSELRSALLASASDAEVVPWAVDADAVVSGDVAWSDVRNEGYMRIEGLEPNDPDVSQYQLWIFRGTDPATEPFPVDGGVFDVDEGGEAIIPIDAKIAVGHAGLFAVTVEKPGGVVVSAREQIVLVAARK